MINWLIVWTKGIYKLKSYKLILNKKKKRFENQKRKKKKATKMFKLSNQPSIRVRKKFKVKMRVCNS